MSYGNILDEHILNIVQTEVIYEQNDLQQSLMKRGLEIPQATLSRRLKKLQIAKVGGAYRVIDFNKPSLPLVLSLQISEFGLIVLHTHPGHASSLASYLDNKYIFAKKEKTNSGLIGTIAGDDTVLLIIQSKSELNSILHLLQEEFPYLTL